MSDGPGLYIHIPFCRQLCPYCDFAVAVRREPPFRAYVDALITEFEARTDRGESFRTIYLGGGTPALLPNTELQRLMDAVSGDHAVVEVTLEANPHDVTPAAVDAWRAAGIRRLSIGVQSFDDDYLEQLGRDHDGRTARRAVEVAMLAELRVTMDLIWGGPGHDASIARADVATVGELGVGHVSAYELTVEEKTVFGRRHRAGELPLPDEEEAAALGRLVVDGLASLGFDRYEVSSHARSESERAVHNSAYWLGRPYVGIGMGAHSLEIGDAIRRRRNVSRLGEYVANPAAAAEVEELSALQHLRERLFLAARTTLGVPYHRLRRDFATLDDQIWDAVARWHEHGVHQRLLEDDSTTIRATPRGLDFADTSAESVWDFVA